MGGLDDEGDLVAVRRGARTGRGQRAERRRAVPFGSQRSRQQPTLGAHRLLEATHHLCPHATSANAAAAASTVRSSCSSLCASDGNQASNCDGGG